MSNDLVSNFKFIVHGKKSPKGFGRVRKSKISTNDLVGYCNYTTRETAKGIDGYDIDVNKGYLEYTSRNSASVKTFSSVGWLDTPRKLKEFKKTISSAFSKDGDIAWIPVQSFKDYATASQYGLFGSEDYAAITSKVLTKFFKHVGLEESNMIWWMDHHQDKNHPHVHLVFLEKEKTRTRGKFTQKQIDYFKGHMFQEMKLREAAIENTYDHKLEAIKSRASNRGRLVDTVNTLVKEKRVKLLNEEITLLAKVLPKTGRLQYNSTNMIEHRPRIDKVVNSILNIPEVKESYEQLVEQWMEEDRVKYFALGDDVGNIFENEDSKLRIRIANSVLQSIKEAYNVEPSKISARKENFEPNYLKSIDFKKLEDNYSNSDKDYAQIGSLHIAAALKKLDGNSEIETDKAQDLYYEGVEF